MKIAFWGTPDLTITILDALESAGFTPCVIVTGPDRKQGRGMLLTSPEPKLWAQKRNIPVLQPEKLDTDFISKLSSYSPDISVVVAYGKIISKEIINLPKYGTLNIHYSLLPRFRGATPVESAILNGETETGVCIQQMVFKLDAGPIHAQESVSIESTETTTDLRARLNIIGARLLVETLSSISSNTALPKEQDETHATHCGKISKEDGLIDPSGDPILNDRKFRAYTGWPGVYFFTNHPTDTTKKIRVVVKKAHLGNGKFIIETVVPEGKKEIPYSQFLNQK